VAASLRVAVVTPYHREPIRYLQRCADSVAKQTYPCEHIWIADGFASPEVESWTRWHVSLSKCHENGGATPRGIGTWFAAANGFDAVAYLDADNWYKPDHIAELVRLHTETRAALLVARRSIHRADGSVMFALDDESDGIEHADTSCIMIARAAFGTATAWLAVSPEYGPLCDRIFWYHARELYPRAVSSKATVCFQTMYPFHYRRVREPVPDGAKRIEHCIDFWNSLDEARRDEFVRACLRRIDIPRGSRER
jgi:glycosyltransferase involved in cell wall biosynthesis